VAGSEVNFCTWPCILRLSNCLVQINLLLEICTFWRSYDRKM